MQRTLFDTDPHPETERALEICDRLKKESAQWEVTAVQETQHSGDAFRTLVAAMLSARTREEDTRAATDALFSMANTPAAMLELTDEQIEAAIRPVNYHRNKVTYVRKLCQKLVEDHDGDVPQTLDELTALAGVGWKTAVLTQWIAFGIAEAVCVDVHVARIAKRLGLVKLSVKQPPKVSDALIAILPKELWGPWNPLMVRFGRNVCFPVDPNCDHCPVYDLCPRVGV